MADRSFLNWPFFDETHRTLAAEFDRWAEEKLAALIAHDHGHDDRAMDAQARRLAASLGDGGWLDHCVGGSTRDGLDVRSLCLLREGLAYRSGMADVVYAMQGLGAGPISFFGSGEQQDRYLPGVARGEKIAAFAISEAQAGSDPGAMAMSAARDGNVYVLNGTKTWISNAGLADFYTVFARTGEAPGAKGISAFIVDADAPGLSVPERIQVIAPHPLGTLDFDGVRVEADAMIGAPGEGFKIAMATLDVFRSTVGAAALGMARRALDEALAYSAARDIGGRPLSDYQMTQDRIADMAVAVDTAALLVYRAAWTKDQGAARITREASMAKYHATEAAQRVIDGAVQLFGGAGVVSGATVERLYREIRALRIYEGTSEIQKLIIAGQTRRMFEDNRA